MPNVFAFTFLHQQGMALLYHKVVEVSLPRNFWFDFNRELVLYAVSRGKAAVEENTLITVWISRNALQRSKFHYGLIMEIRALAANQFICK